MATSAHATSCTEEFLIGYLQVAPPEPIREKLDQTRLFLTPGVPVTLGLVSQVGFWGLAMQPIRLTSSYSASPLMLPMSCELL